MSGIELSEEAFSLGVGEKWCHTCLCYPDLNGCRGKSFGVKSKCVAVTLTDDERTDRAIRNLKVSRNKHYH